ncbi:MAG: HAMP domain-containing histidine kinase [Candidatus Vogelbacteria bacterium]|nr:HAMP domain-containing histidine kinase [Candidatus Vogelbacteria bacterium]
MQIDILHILLGALLGSSIFYWYETRTKQKISSLSIEAIIHELKTPLTGLSWIFSSLSELKEGELLNRETLVLLKEGMVKIGNALELTNDALSALNTSPDYATYKFRNYDLVSIISKVIDENSLSAKEKSIDLYYKQGKSPVSLYCDEIKLTLAIRNIVSNAIKYTPSNGKIIIDTKQSDDEIVISVSDNGIGIPATEINKVFNKFYRAHNIGDISGSGLGLFIVKNIIAGHDGRIEIQSTEGRGTKITIFLPVKK